MIKAVTTAEPKRTSLFGGSSSFVLSGKARGLMRRAPRKRSTASNRRLLSRSTPVLHTQDLSSDFSIELSERSNDDLSALLSSQLHYVKMDKTITRLKLNNFVKKSDLPNFSVVKGLLSGDPRPWKSVRFADTVQGEVYRRWLMQKESLCRRMVSLEDELGISVTFTTRVEVSFQKLSQESIVALLEAIQQDRDVSSLCFKGVIEVQDIEGTVNAISDLMRHDVKRRWDGIVFHVSYGGPSCDMPMWSSTIRKYGLRLEKLAAQYNIPLGFKMLP